MSNKDKVYVMDELFRLSQGKAYDPEIDAWFDARPDELGHMARSWFDEMRAAGDDVLELLHDGYPVACVEDAPFGYVNVSLRTSTLGFLQEPSCRILWVSCRELASVCGMSR